MIFIPTIIANIRTDDGYTGTNIQSSHSNKILRWLEENVPAKSYKLEYSTSIWFGEIYSGVYLDEYHATIFMLNFSNEIHNERIIFDH